MKHRSLIAVLLMTGAMCALPACGQTSSGEQKPASAGNNSAKAAFEVATIKPEAPGAFRYISLNIYPNGRISITGYTLKELICAAYHLNYDQVKGGDTWIDKDIYDLEAIPANATDGTPTYDLHHDNWSFEDSTLQTMLQELLADRFKLKTHVVVTQGPVYLLERGDKKLALTPSQDPPRYGGLGGIGARGGAGYRLSNTSMPQLAAYLGGIVLHETVIDKTGLTGAYDFDSKTILSDQDWKNNDPSSFLPAVKEMGLKLTKSTGPITTLVVDQVAHPSPN